MAKPDNPFRYFNSSPEVIQMIQCRATSRSLRSSKARVRTWAEAMQLKRSEAIRVLVQAALDVVEDDD